MRTERPDEDPICAIPERSELSSPTIGLSVAEVDALLNNDSGLKGICGENDMREVLRLAHDGDQQTALAVEMYTY